VVDDLDPDRRVGIVEADADELALVVEDNREVAGHTVGLHTRDR